MFFSSFPQVFLDVLNVFSMCQSILSVSVNGDHFSICMPSLKCFIAVCGPSLL